MRILTKTLLVLLLAASVTTVIVVAGGSSDTAEMLVRTADGPAGRKEGDIVSMKLVPHAGWGNAEGPPDYYIVRVSGVNFLRFKDYHHRHCLKNATDDPADPNTVWLRSRYRLDLSRLPSADGDGLISVNRNTCLTTVIDRRTE